jgi:O-antigen/teichoic acid export membrane protein
MAYSLRSILRGSSIFAVGQILTRATGFFLIPIYTRFLTPEDYGIIGILSVVVGLTTSVLSLGASQTQMRYYHEYEEDRRKVGELLFSINVLLFGVAIVVCGSLTALGKPLFQPLIDNPAITFVPFVVIAIWMAFFTALSQLISYYYVATKQFAYCAVLQFVQFILIAGFIIVFVVFMRQGALGSIKGSLIGLAVFSAVFYWPYARNFVWRLNTDYVRQVLNMGLPIMVHTTAAAAMVSLDKLILNKYLTLSSVGIYTLGYKFGLVMSIVVMSVNRAWMPNYYELMKQQELDRAREIRRMFCVWITSIGALCIGVGAWSREVVELLTTEAYFSAATVIPLILLGFFFQGIYFFMSGPIFYFKKTHLLPFMTVSAALLNVGLNFLLIPKLDMMGAAITTAVSFLFLALAAYFLGRKYFDPHFEFFRLSLLMIVVSAASIANILVEPGLMFRICMVVGYLALCYLFFPVYLKPFVRRVVSYVRW